MKNKILQFISNYKLEIILFIVSFLLIALRLRGLFSMSQLPGWDTSSHFYALNKMVFEYLPQGHIIGYLQNWLGGMPLFQFYAPFYFLVVAVIYKITFGVIALPLLFKLSILFILYFFTFSFWYWTKAFFGQGVARWAIPMSLLYIFYPKVYAVFGIGASAMIEIGFITSTFGICFIFLLLGFVKKYKDTRLYIYFVLSSITIFLLIFTHTLSALWGLFFVFIFTLFSLRDRQFVKNIIYIGILGLGMSLFWLVPFVFNLNLTAGDIRDISWVANPLFPVLPVRASYYVITSVVMSVLSLLGLYIVIRKKYLYILGLFIFSVLFIIFGSYIPRLLPNFTMHYNRFIPIFFVIILTLSALGIDFLWSLWGNKTSDNRVLFIIMIVLIALQSVWFFDYQVIEQKNFKVPLVYNWNNYPLIGDANDVIEKLSELSDVRRIFVEIPSQEGLQLLGSYNYFTSQIPLNNNQYVITGDYVESSLLTPLVLPTIKFLTKGQYRIWGEDKITTIGNFSNQDDIFYLKRLQLLGVNYIITSTSRLYDVLSNYKDAKFVDGNNYFAIFKLNNSRPYVYQSSYKPVLFLEGNNLSFSEAEKILFVSDNTYDIPLVKVGKKDLTALNNFDNFSALVISGDDIKTDDYNFYISLDLPLIFIGDFDVDKFDITSQNITVIKNIKSLALNNSVFYSQLPQGWQSFQKAISSMVRSQSIDNNPKILVFDNNEIAFQSESLTFISSNYSPYWQSKNSQILRANLGSMLVVGDGVISLQYKADILKKIAIFASLLSFVILFVFCVYQRKNLHS